MKAGTLNVLGWNFINERNSFTLIFYSFFFIARNFAFTFLNITTDVWLYTGILFEFDIFAISRTFLSGGYRVFSIACCMENRKHSASGASFPNA